MPPSPMNGDRGPTMQYTQRCWRPKQKPSVILRYDTVVSIVLRANSSFKRSEVKCTSRVSANWPRPVPPPLPTSHRSEGIITNRWAITSLLILDVTSEVCSKAGWPNGTLVHPRHPPVSPTQQTVIDFCKLSYYDDSLLFGRLFIFPLFAVRARLRF